MAHILYLANSQQVLADLRDPDIRIESIQLAPTARDGRPVLIINVNTATGCHRFRLSLDDAIALRTLLNQIPLGDA